MMRTFALTLTSCLATGLLLGTTGCATPAAAPATTVEIYAVKDLVFPAADRPAFIALDDLAANIRMATGADWQATGHSIRTEDSGFMAVTAAPAVHAKVAIVLADIRRFAAKPR